MPLYNRRPEPGLSASPPAALPLAELLARVRQTLSERFADSYWVLAEIADLTVPRFDGAHCYLTLTDQHTTGRGAQLKAQARATIWSQRYQQLAPAFEQQTGLALKVGLKVMLRVQVKFHEQFGLSLDVVAIDPTYTVGDLARQRLETLRKLEAKGLLERQRRLTLPIGVQRVAVVSSPTAAGWQDFVQQLREAPFYFALTLFPASMQGDDSPASIRAALAAIKARRREYDAVVIIRGGGSKTDLLAFDDYGLAAAVGAFPLPIITGIGHERDEAVVDLTAHTSLKTPTAVAAFLIERLARLEAALDGYGGRIRELAQARVQDATDSLHRLLRRSQQHARQQLQEHRETLHQRIRLAAAAPRAQLRQQEQQLTRRRHQLHRAARTGLRSQEGRLRTFGRALAQRFRRLHRRRCEQLLRRRYQLQLAAERLLHQAELRLLQLQISAAASPVEQPAELASVPAAPLRAKPTTPTTSRKTASAPTKGQLPLFLS
ncbi:exodeoxyribonuclease VII large subunit [Hymenobacter taeanensis]|uniref:Exodeoxyribonuclease 7 large subunit n=1 Tax=Hymenobacter taeanensis TaxID=2735321 RepID=A0A6M6BIQ5_9BACT|nr:MULTISPECIES: exodeoxyribonuclease VII large subunit [Hymenobacter]QJX47674.1 exodeoxyribonuclease VII large subunit [Hymenobacter taeanensis]UOQ82843.1 exodeoxyribonuclease VII large subunit [Hymenobacter sp. 5414T-23]